MLRLPTSCKQHETRHSKPASFAEARQATNPVPGSAAPDETQHVHAVRCIRKHGSQKAKDHPPLKSCAYAYGEACHHISGHCERCRTRKGKGSIEEVVDQACRTCSQHKVSSNSELKKDVQLQAVAAVAPYSHPKRTAMWQDRLLSLDKMSLTSMKATNRNICLPGSGQV